MQQHSLKGIAANYILRRFFRVLVENYILWGFFRGNGGELYSEGFFREFGGKSNSLGDFSLDWRKIIFFWDFKGFVFELISVFTWSEFLLCLHLVESLSLFLSLNDVLGLMYCGGASLCCGLFTLGRGSNIPASSQSATNPKLAHPPLRNYGKPLHPHFSLSLQKTIRYFVRYFALDFFVKQAPAPPFLTECLLVVSKWITIMHQIPNGINHWITFPPIHCVK